MPHLTIKIGDKSIETDIPEGANLVDYCAENKIPLPYDCRSASCGTCRVRVTKNAENLSKIDDAEEFFLEHMAPEDTAPNDRLACQCMVLGDVEIELIDTGNHDFPNSN